MRFKKRKINGKKSRKLFSRTARKVNRKNGSGSIMRGGYRL